MDKVFRRVANKRHAVDGFDHLPLPAACEEFLTTSFKISYEITPSLAHTETNVNSLWANKTKLPRNLGSFAGNRLTESFREA